MILSKRMQQSKEAIYYIMNKLELTIHDGKTKLVDMYFGKEEFDFLGFHNQFKRGRTKHGSDAGNYFKYHHIKL